MHSSEEINKPSSKKRILKNRKAQETNKPGDSPKLTKLQVLLIERNMPQHQLGQKILDKFGKYYSKGYISKLVTGQAGNIRVSAAYHFARALGVRIENIIEDDILGIDQEINETS